MKRNFFLSLFALILAACSSNTEELDKQQLKDLQDAAESFVLPEGPTLQNAAGDSINPVYLFLFTHTEDHINHELSEDRYFRIGEMIEDLASKNPRIPLNWTIEFQGADAETIAERNQETGVLDYLMGLQSEGLVNFGYHAHHDPTYMNRPQNSLSEDPSWEDAYDALYKWITCTKDPLKGGCISATGGGLQAILNNFGEVAIVTGLGIGEGTQVERSAGSMAVLEELPDRLLGFGFPDHGATVGKKQNGEDSFVELRDQLMDLLSPTNETSAGTLWMDNSIRINDGAPVDGTDSLNLIDGKSSVENDLKSLDRSSPHVINTGIASKYLYTKEGTSPTIWAYQNPDSPELPAKWLNPTSVIERNYQLTKEALTYLTEEFIPQNPGSAWLSPEDVVTLFTSEDYWQVDEDELENIALWILNEWEEAPPVYAYDGEDFYSLVDAFALLRNGLIDDSSKETLVSKYYGPWSLLSDESAAVTIRNSDLDAWLETWDYENRQMSESFYVGELRLSPAQILYALAMKTLNPYAESIDVPATQNAPVSYSLLEGMGCTDCLDTAWSLKPARFQD